MSEASHQRSDQQMRISLENIDATKYDVRDEVDDDHVTQIAESLEDDGQWNPIIVRRDPGHDGTYQLIAGHTRFRAAQRIGWDELEATVKDIDDERANELALKTNLKRKGMSKIEEGKVINDILSKHNLTQGELAEKLGKSPRWVSERIRVALELDPKVKGLVQEGELSYNIARIVTQVGKDRQLDFAEYLLENNVTAAAEASRFKQRFENDTLYTVGYEGRDFDEFVEHLQENDVEVLVDVRKSGDSTYKPQFSADVLSERLPEEGIEYEHVPELGVDRLVRNPYKDGWLADDCFASWYDWWVEESADVDLQQFIEDLEDRGSPALMCIERHAKPVEGQSIYCHRHHLAEKIQDFSRDGRKMFPIREDL